MSSGVARAALLSVDSGFGNGTVTRDTATGLDWLDWTSTTGISFNQMIPMLLAGGAFEGWRYATEAEVDTLYFSSAGISNADSVADRAADILVLQDLLGRTFLTGTLGDPGFAQTASRAMFDIPQSLGRALSELVVWTQDGPFTLALADVNAGSINDSFAGNGNGHILVRTFAPEPATLALLGIGLTAALTRSRRRGPAPG